MLNHPQMIQIRAHTVLLLREYGWDIRGREKIVLALMDEYGISDRSACQYLVEAKKRLKRMSRKHGTTK